MPTAFPPTVAVANLSLSAEIETKLGNSEAPLRVVFASSDYDKEHTRQITVELPQTLAVAFEEWSVANPEFKNPVTRDTYNGETRSRIYIKSTNIDQTAYVDLTSGKGQAKARPLTPASIKAGDLVAARVVPYFFKNKKGESAIAFHFWGIAKLALAEPKAPPQAPRTYSAADFMDDSL